MGLFHINVALSYPGGHDFCPQHKGLALVGFDSVGKMIFSDCQFAVTFGSPF